MHQGLNIKSRKRGEVKQRSQVEVEIKAKVVEILAGSESGNGAVVATVKRIVESIQGIELSCQLHAFATLGFNAAPVPLAIVSQVDIAHVDSIVANLIGTANPAAGSLRQQA